MTASQVRAEARSVLKGNWKKGALITFIFILVELLISFAISFLEEHVVVLAFIASIASTVITVPLSCGFLYAFMKLVNGEDVKYFDFFELGFSNFKRFWCVFGRMLLKLWPYLLGAFVCMFLCTFLLSFGMTSTFLLGNITISLISMILGFLAFGGYIALVIIAEVKMLLYYLAYPLAIDNPEIPAKEVVNMSKDLMLGNRGKLFCLFLSFIGWILLAMAPYLVFSTMSIFASNPFIIIVGLISLIIAYCFLVPYILSAFIVFYKKRVENSNQVVQGNNEIEQDNPIK